MARKVKEIVEERIEDETGLTKSYNEIEDDHLDPIEERKELIEDLFEKAEAYAKTNVELFKLKATEKLSEIVASLIARIILIIFFSFFFLMVNVGFAIWIGDAMGHMYYGFFIIAGLYLVIAILIYAFRKSLIKKPIIDSIISQVLK